jgi:hypothetical protein
MDAPHYPNGWLRELDAAGSGTAKADMRAIRALRRRIQNQTCSALVSKCYTIADGRRTQRVELPEVPRDTFVYHSADDTPHHAAAPESAAEGDASDVPASAAATDINTEVEGGLALGPAAGATDSDAASASAGVGTHTCTTTVVEGDCVATALELRRRGLKVAMLNMANAHTPGGGWVEGCGAQEENLHRRSDLHLFLDDPHRATWKDKGRRCYPIPTKGALYSPCVRFFRGSEAEGYPFLREVVEIDVVSTAAVANPRTVRGTGGRGGGGVGGGGGHGSELRLAPDEAELLSAKICTVLAAARAHGANALVLSALGCGAFRNPPGHVAELFHRQLTSAAFAGAFQEVVFAIFDDHNAHHAHNPEGNVVPFRRVFEPRVPL